MAACQFGLLFSLHGNKTGGGTHSGVQKVQTKMYSHENLADITKASAMSTPALFQQTAKAASQKHGFILSPVIAPPHVSRQAAREEGRKFYFEASGCKYGHVNNKRYTTTGDCQLCSKERGFFSTYRSANFARDVARAKGDKSYQGSPCTECGATLRNVKTGACVACFNA